VTLTPTPGAGWHFDHWEGALSGNQNPAQITMDGPKTVTAVFVIDQHSLNVLVTGQGSVTMNPTGGSYATGTSVTLTPTPGAGWHFDHWEGALSGNATPAQITVDADAAFTAVFLADTFALDVNVTGEGSVTLDPVGGAYSAGQLVTLTATAAEGWLFDRWEGALSGGATYTQLTMDTDKAVTAVFVRKQYTLTISIEGGGSVTLEPPGGTYPSGTVVTLTPKGNADTRFEIWGGNLLGTRQPATVTMDGGKYVEAFFMPRLHKNFYPNNLRAVGSTLYFLGAGLYSGQELWKSDGTFEGTVLVKDIAPIDQTPGISFLVNLNDTLYFFAQAGGYALWKSDGTEAGTLKVADLGSSFPALAPVKVGGKMFWSANGTQGGELWSSDGTEAGTGVVKCFGILGGSNPNMLTDVEGVLYFNNLSATDTFTLWKSDGTDAGTIPIYSTRWLSEIASLNGQVFFYAGTVADDSLFTTDGTPAGTHKLRDFFFGPGDFTRSGNLLYFAAEPFDLYNTRVYATNGTDVYLVDAGAWRPWDLIDLNGKLLFEALYEVNSVAHCGLFASTGSGASLLREINPTLFYGVESYHAVVDDTLYFAAENSYGGLGLWKSDGTGAGTVMVSDINSTGLGPYYMTNVDGTLFFAAQDDAHGIQLWKSDGTLAGTLPVSCPTP
jgi:ELWxxDGT repeat protein